MAKIVFDYALAIRQAERLEEAARRMDRLVSETENALGTVSAHWSGESAGGYQKKGRRLSEMTRQKAALLHREAREVRRIAEYMRQLELDNAGLH